MRKLLALLPIVAVVVGANALVASAGSVGETPPPATVGYTILITDLTAGAGDVATTGDTAATTEATDDGTLQVPDLFAGGVAPQQGNCEGQLATVDLTTGVVTALPASVSAEACVGDLTFGPDGTLYGLLFGFDASSTITELVRFDTTSGAATVIGQIGSFNSYGGEIGAIIPLGGLAFDAQGHLFVELLGISELSNPDEECVGDDLLVYCLYRIDDPNDPGATTFVGRSFVGDDEGDIYAVSTLNASCTTMYAGSIDLDVEDESESVVTVDTTTGALTDLGRLRDLRFLMGQATDRAGTLWALEAIDTEDPEIPFELATLDPAGGTPIDTTVQAVELPGDEGVLNGLAIEPLDCTPEPEPVVLAPTFTG